MSDRVEVVVTRVDNIPGRKEAVTAELTAAPVDG
jgi:hypothetical protein